MDQLKNLISGLSIAQRISILAAALLVVGGLVAFSHWKHESDFRPLYTAMSPDEAGAVVQKIKETGTEYRLSESGGAVLVPSARIAELRLQLAAAGLPKSGRIGYELFDKSAFGATEYVEHINYHRALEGELERSVTSLAEVEQARVHLTFPKDSVFLEAQQPAKASVMVKLKPGAHISSGNVQAICHLVASAVEGLVPEAVSVVDMSGRLLSRLHRAGAAGDLVDAGDDALELRQRLEQNLVNKVNATLEPLLGADKFRAGASVDFEMSSGEESEETFDPAKSVMVSSQRTEEGGSGPAPASGIPGTASNLPRPTSRPGSSSASGISRVTEDITYQSSRLTRHTRKPQGAIKRMSISVLVDQSVRWEGAGARKQRVLVPPSPETLKSIHEVVAAATGFSAERGDQLIVETLPFESTLNQEPMLPASPPQAAPLVPKNLLLPVGAGAAGVILLLAFVLMRGRKRRPEPATVTAAPQLQGREVPDLDLPLAGPETAAPSLESAAGSMSLEQPVFARAALETPSLRDSIRVAVLNDSVGSSRVIRAWLNEKPV